MNHRVVKKNDDRLAIKTQLLKIINILFLQEQIIPRKVEDHSNISPDITCCTPKKPT
jgi:soluble cytochrome b562